MIIRRCDKCGKELEPIYNFPFPSYCTPPEPVFLGPKLYFGFKRENGQIIPIDLCPECDDAVYDYIFNLDQIDRYEERADEITNRNPNA